MKVYENYFSYDFSFPTVTLAYFLRYPNPYSRHVLSTDVIDRYVDPTTQRLHTTRLHLKRSKIPSAMLRLLPSGTVGAGGAGQSYILEKTVVDVGEGWMQTESRNMEWTGILSVVEHQKYWRQLPDEQKEVPTTSTLRTSQPKETTDVKTTVVLNSRLGQGKLMGRKRAESSSSDSPASGDADDELPRKGFFATWSTAGVQRTIELIGVKRTEGAVVKSKEGMTLVMERLRKGGIVGVLEGMRQDRDAAFGPEGAFKRAWLRDNQGNESDEPQVKVEQSFENRHEEER